MFIVPQNLVDQLRRDEGLKLKPYRDSVGKLTIGVGRNLDDIGIRESEAELMLGNDIQVAAASLIATFPWVENLDEVRRSAMVNMTFNMGIGSLSGFKHFLAKMQEGDFSAAAGAMLDSEWAKQVGERSTRLSQQIETGNWS